MENLIGKSFQLEETQYAIVDVRNIKGDTLVYAEPASGAAGPGRAAFRYVDIESLLDPAESRLA